MNRATAIVTLLLCAPAAPAEPVPEGVTISKWVREDLFAGFLADSMDEFNRGVAKLDEILTGAPDNGTAVVWRASVDARRIAEHLLRATSVRVHGHA